jgi:hypothetical protein
MQEGVLFHSDCAWYHIRVGIVGQTEAHRLRERMTIQALSHGKLVQPLGCRPRYTNRGRLWHSPTDCKNHTHTHQTAKQGAEGNFATSPPPPPPLINTHSLQTHTPADQPPCAGRAGPPHHPAADPHETARRASEAVCTVLLRIFPPPAHQTRPQPHPTCKAMPCASETRKHKERSSIDKQEHMHALIESLADRKCPQPRVEHQNIKLRIL